MDLNEVTILYRNLFENMFQADIFEKISLSYQCKYNTFLEFKNKGYNSPTAMGRDKIAYGRNIIYGWFLEELLAEFLQNNQFIKNIAFFGKDKNHDFVYFHNEKNIKIAGTKSADPDILITLKSDVKFLVEIKTAAKNIFTVKDSNIQNLINSTAQNDLSCIVLMLDLINGRYEIQDLNFFFNKKPFSNTNLEGQLCYDFPTPSTPLSGLLTLDFETFLDLSILEHLQVKKFRLLKIATEKNNKQMIKIIKDKIALDKLTEKKEIDIKNYDEKIQEIIAKNIMVLKSWEEIELLT